MVAYTSNSNLKNWYPNHFVFLTDTRPVLETSENKSTRFQTKETLIRENSQNIKLLFKKALQKSQDYIRN